MGWDLSSDRPIYAQLVDQIKLKIISNEYPAGSKLPSVRDMAALAAVNPNTMQRALAQLESEGLLYSQRTSGRFVTEDGERIMESKNALAKELIHEFLERMSHLGYTREQALDIVRKTAEEGK